MVKGVNSWQQERALLKYAFYYFSDFLFEDLLHFCLFR